MLFIVGCQVGLTAKFAKMFLWFREHRSLKWVRYADDFSIYCSDGAEARKTGNEIYLFLKNKLKLPINREKSSIRPPEEFTTPGIRLRAVPPGKYMKT
jgi:hypothetical protein